MNALPPFSQRGPPAFQALPLDLPDLALADLEAADDQPAGLGHGFDEGERLHSPSFISPRSTPSAPPWPPRRHSRCASFPRSAMNTWKPPSFSVPVFSTSP